ncbi:MAG: type II toxin-antitoxin system HicA family toxin [Blastocatellia bacterium]
MIYRDIAKKPKALGCQELPRRGTGSHRKWFNPKTHRVTIIPNRRDHPYW